MRHKDQVLTSKEQHVIFKRLLSYTKQHTKVLIGAFILLLIATGSNLVGPILVKVFIDDYLTPRSFPFEPLLFLAVLYLVLHVSAVVLLYFQSLLFQKVALRIIQQLRIDVFSKVQKLGLSFFDKTAAGGLVSRITNDTESIKEMYVTVIVSFIQNIIMLIGIFVAMFYLNAYLAFFCLFLFPVLFYLVKTYRKLSSVYYANMSEKLSELNGRINESIQGMSIIQLFRQEKRMKQEFEEINQAHQTAMIKNMKLDGLLLRPAVDLVSIIALVIVLAYFGGASLSSSVEIGVLYAFVNYLNRFFEPVNQMMMRLSIFQQAIVSAGRVFKLLDHDELAPERVGTTEPTIQKGEIEFRNVTFSYDGKTDVLKNISFRVKEGETLALVGHTGSGKSSIINLFMRFYPYQQGEILIDGIPLEQFSEQELRTRVGLVLQDSFLYTGTIESNIRLFNQTITEQGIKEAAEFVHADSFIEKLPGGYQSEVSERGSTLSSGQRQLISFARTMAMKPKILILDEATANVDTETEEKIQTALGKMRRGRTTIAIAHRLSTIKDADHIVVLHQGEIVEEGNHESLLEARGLYYKMYLLQQGFKEEEVSL